MPITSNRTVINIWQLATWLRGCLDQTLSVAFLAQRVGMSERSFHRAFKDIMHETPADHLLRLRLERSAIWLAYTDFPVIDAALAGGYDSREAFTRMFHARFDCTPCDFRAQVRTRFHSVPDQPPSTLGKPYEMALPPMRLAAWPHLGSVIDASSTWLKLGRWGRKNNLLTPHTLPVSVMYDDTGVISSIKARLDATLVIAARQLSVDRDDLPFVYDLPGGRHVIAPFVGSLYQLEGAWDYFSLRWFPASGHALRDSRLLMLHDASDVPTCACDYFPVVAGRILHCRLCIPVDGIPAWDLPPIQASCVR